MQAALPDDSDKVLRSKLFMLVCNVCLIYAGNNNFVPRIEMESTRCVGRWLRCVRLLLSWRSPESCYGYQLLPRA